MNDPVAAGMRDLAGTQLYRRNAFRVTGLPTGADRRLVRQRRQRMTAALQVGADIDTAEGVTEADARAAFDRLLGDPRLRLVDELFWVWGEPDGCGCTARMHDDHDCAVRAHCEAIERAVASRGEPRGREPGGMSTLWDEAARRWARTLRRASLWDHVRYRVVQLDERQLDKSAIDALRKELPRTLLRPLVDVAAAADEPDRKGYADLARSWPAPAEVLDDELESVATAQYEAAKSARTEAVELLEAGQPSQAVDCVHSEVMPVLRRLEELVPSSRHRRTADAWDRAAIVVNNCATHLLSGCGATEAAQTRSWLDAAKGLATDEDTVTTIKRNRADVDHACTAYKRLRAQAIRLARAEGWYMARYRLRELKKASKDPALSAEVDHLLTELSEYQSRQEARKTTGGSQFGLVVFVAILVVGAALALVFL